MRKRTKDDNNNDEYEQQQLQPEVKWRRRGEHHGVREKMEDERDGHLLQKSWK
jgi:hypothetical protein